MTQETKISRNNFLKQMGFSGAALFALYTLDSCKSSGVEPSPLTSPITLDLNATANANLKKDGGYVITGDVVVARVNATTYIAATLVCSHEGLKQMTFKSNEWYCTAHGARFDQSGKGLNSEAKAGLTVYKTALSGTNLTVSQ